MKKIYIAGKVTGEDKSECAEKFKVVQESVEALGFEVVNPLKVVGDWQTPWNQAMRMCIAKLMECDAIVLLPCWIQSKGAKIQWDISKQLEMPDFRGTKDGLQALKIHVWNN